jgi:hypothetical protein
MARTLVVSAYDLNGMPCQGCQFELFLDGKLAGTAEHTDGKTMFTIEGEAQISVTAAFRDQTTGPIKLSSTQDCYEFCFDVVLAPTWRNIVATYFPAIIGIVFMLLALVMAFVFKTPTPLQIHILLALFAIGGGGFGGQVAGFLNVNLTLTDKLKVTAGGACAFFVLLYFFVPAHS